MAMEAAKQALGDAQRFESRNWKKALELYNQLARSMETPPLYRETALFSLSRLTADKLRDTAAAMRDFSSYLILYPRGMFAGEALLRLSELELTRNPASAVDYFRKFLATSPNHPRRADVAYHMGLLLQQHDEYSDAISMFTIALDETKATRPERRHEIARMIADAESLIEAGRAKPAALKSR
jgi:tetratricopeptide (TPR) repeat protein